MKNKLTAKMIGMMAAATVFSMITAGCGSTSALSENKIQKMTLQDAEEKSNTENALSEKKASSESVSDKKKNDIDETKSAAAKFEPITVVDNDECKLVITGTGEDKYMGFQVKVNLENKSADKSYRFEVNDASINGISISPYWSETVASGKKSVDTVDFMDYYTDPLKENGLKEYTDIEMTFVVRDSDDWSVDPVATETVHIYPLGKDKAVKFVREDQDSDVVLVDNDKIKVVVIGSENDDIWGYSLKLYMENKTDQPIRFSFDDVSVNGYMCDPYWIETIGANKVGFDKASWYHEKLEEIDIKDSKEIEEIEFKLIARHADDYLIDPYFEEVLTVNVKESFPLK